MEPLLDWGVSPEPVTWKDWFYAFLAGIVVMAGFATWWRTGNGWHAWYAVMMAVFAVRQFLGFRRKVRILTDFAKPNGA